MTTIDQIPAPQDGAMFQLIKIETVCLPHPYCITGKHVVIAAAIEDAERRGAQCDICRYAALPTSAPTHGEV